VAVACTREKRKGAAWTLHRFVAAQDLVIISVTRRRTPICSSGLVMSACDSCLYYLTPTHVPRDSTIQGAFACPRGDACDQAHQVGEGARQR
jgi:hypothetical protein